MTSKETAEAELRAATKSAGYWDRRFRIDPSDSVRSILTRAVRRENTAYDQCVALGIDAQAIKRRNQHLD